MTDIKCGSVITSEDIRRDKLISAGVPSEFLDAIENPSEFTDLEFLFQYPKSFYWYYPDIASYECLQGFEVTPIFDGSNGDTFFVMLSKQGERHFAWFELEQDEIYESFGSNFMYLLAYFLIKYYESTELNLDQLSEYGEQMGFEKSRQLFSMLADADEKCERMDDVKWRSANLGSLRL